MNEHGFILEKIKQLSSWGYSEDFQALVYIHFATGCRVSDLLRLTGADFSSSYHVRIKQGKGSDDLIYKLSDYYHVIDRWRTRNTKISGTYSRQSLHRIYKKLGFSISRGENRNSSVTHFFRVIKARDLVTAFDDKELAGKVLGHRSKKSIEYYINDMPSRARLQRGVNNSATGDLGGLQMNRKGVIFKR